MFGTLKPSLSKLPTTTQHSYRELYCGMCAGLGQHFDLATRATLSHDTVLVATIIEGLLVKESAPDRTRCPMMPLHHRPTKDADSVSIRFASALHMLLIDQWLADKAIDGAPIHGAARSLVAQRATRARALFDELGVALPALDGLERRQAKLERQLERQPHNKAIIRRASQPTAQLLGQVFGQIAHLEGVAPYPALKRQLERLGQALGQSIYALDALEDLSKDLKRGHFNPCLEPGDAQRPQLSSARTLQVIDLLRRSHQELERALTALELRRHRALIEHTLLTQHKARQDSAIARAMALLPEHEQAPLTMPDKLKLARAAFIAMMWSLLVSMRQLWAFWRYSWRMAWAPYQPPQQCQIAQPALMLTSGQALSAPGLSLGMSMSSSQEEERRRRETGAEDVAEGCECCCESMECCCQMPECCSSCSSCCSDCPCSDCPCGDCSCDCG